MKTHVLLIVDTDLLSNISDSDSKEEEDQHDSNIEFTPQRDIDRDPTSASSQQPKWVQQLIEEAGDCAGDSNDKRRTRSQYQKENVALSHIYPILPERCFMMLGSDP